MILQALTRYYETLLEQNEIAPRYYTKTGVSFGLRLSGNGDLAGIVPYKESVTRGKKTVEVPQQMRVPEQCVRTGIHPPSNYLCDSARFLLGLDTKGSPEKAYQYFQTAKELHLNILEHVDSEAAKVICAYFQGWSPEKAAESEIIEPYFEGMSKGAQIIFILPDGTYAQNDPSLKSAWEAYKKSTQSDVRMQCLVTGESDAPISAVHPKIKGVQGGSIAEKSLVSFDKTAYESYGHEKRNNTGQGFNAPVSEYAAFAYTSALNHLIADFEHRMPLGGDTIVCWAENGEAKYQDAFLACANPRYDTENEVSQTLKRIVAGSAVDLDGFSVDTPFYVLCLSPNAARVSVRFFLRDTFGNIADHLAEHYRRLEIVMGPKERQYLSPWQILKETTNPKSDDKASSPLLAGATLRAILSGARYPAALYENILLRIRADRKINRARAATIKAYLLKNDTNPEHKEVLTVALNEQSSNKPYILGRLFAMLEQTQKSAYPDIKATITNRCFDSACATPRLAFPMLLKLNRHHIDKVIAKKEKFGKWLEKTIGELVDKLSVNDDPYPARLTLEEQGLFILGYYQQKQARYTKKTESDSEKENA